jgi:hypothetical protein
VTRPDGRSRFLPGPVLVAALLALAAKIVLASSTYGSSDVRSFLYFFRRDALTGPTSVYAMVKDFNHPPPMLYVLRAIHGLSETTGIPFQFWIRLPAILADLGTILVLARVLRPAFPLRTAALVLCAAAPVSVFVSGFHGNTDPLMIFFVVLAIAVLGDGRSEASPRRAAIAGACFGLALDVKVVPLVFGPAILLWLPDWRKRCAFFGAALAVVLITWAPLLLDAPVLVARRVLGYGSTYGLWGISRVIPSDDLRRYGRIFLVLVVLTVSVHMNRASRKVPLFRQAAVVAFAFLAATPGFGVQYLAWLVPFTVALPLGAAVLFHLASGAFLAVVYTFWCGRPIETPDTSWLGRNFWRRGLPWDVANANRIGDWRGEIVWLELACWIAVLVALAALLHGARSRAEREAAPTG